jgi:serine/threonine protein kinase
MIQLQEASTTPLRGKREVKYTAKVCVLEFEYTAIVTSMTVSSLLSLYGVFHFTLQLEPVGYTRALQTLNSRDFASVIYAMIQTASLLEDAGCCHRDLRYGNVLWNGKGEPFIIDLEMACHSGQPVSQ